MLNTPKLFCGLLVLVLATGPLLAQDGGHSAELYGGYSYIRADTGVEDVDINLNGFNVAGTWTKGRWLGLTGEFTGQYTDTDVSVYTYMAGPRVAWPSGRFRPFAHALFGGVSGRVDEGDYSNKFAMAAGGGLDLRIFEMLSLRLAQVEYLYTRLPPGIISVDETQNNLRVGAGVVWRFGGR